MIAAYTVIAMLCFAIGWRGGQFSDLWRRMPVKVFWLSLVMAFLVMFAFESLMLALVTFVESVLVAGLLSVSSFLLGRGGRLLGGSH